MCILGAARSRAIGGIQIGLYLEGSVNITLVLNFRNGLDLFGVQKNPIKYPPLFAHSHIWDVTYKEPDPT